MDSETDRELEVIRAQTHQTRAHLADKLEALESQISQTVAGVTSAVETVTQSVSGVTSAVENVAEKVTDTVSTVTDSVSGVAAKMTDTVSNVTDSVSGTVQQVAQALDVSSKVREMPWTAVGCAFAAGFAGGYASGGRRRRAEGAPPPPSTTTNGHGPASYQQPSSSEPTTITHVTDAMSEIGGAVQSLGISALMGVVTHLAKSAVPEALRNDVAGALDKLKERLGGHHNVSADLFEPKSHNGR